MRGRYEPRISSVPPYPSKAIDRNETVYIIHSYRVRRTLIHGPLPRKVVTHGSTHLMEEHTMSNTSSRQAPQYTAGTAHLRLSRVAMTGVVAVALLAALARASAAQGPATQPAAIELRFTSGGLVPTGAERATIKDAQYSAAQVSWLVAPSLAITSTLGWGRSRDIATSGDPQLDVFTYDLGAEARGAEWFTGKRVTFAPFIGAGAGARSYNYRNLDVDA